MAETCVDDVLKLDASEQASAQQSGTELPPQPPFGTSPALAARHDEQRATLDAPKAASRGAPPGNSSATRSGLRGSKLPRGCSNAERAVLDLVARVRAAWCEKHGAGPIPLAAEVTLKRIRRAEERDRVSAKQLRDGSDLKGNPLTFDQQERLRDAQESAGRIIEEGLKKLGLTATADAQAGNGNSWGDFYREQAAAAAAAGARATESPPIVSEAFSVPATTDSAEALPADAEKPTDEMEDEA